MIKKVYIVHHSHTDVGYTDLQEQIIYNQVNNIRNVVSLVRNGYEQDGPEKGFKWNCETYYCVEQFLKSASPREQEDFFELVRRPGLFPFFRHLPQRISVCRTIRTYRGHPGKNPVRGAGFR